MNEDERIIKNLMDMQHHFNELVASYERLPLLKNIVRKTILEDALSVVAVSMEGITHEIVDLYDLMPMQQRPNVEPKIIEVKPKRDDEE
tara:strand:- start:193 stop:459 length:267 start_codon:yes stop_codon:yes gene_type:complete